MAFVYRTGRDNEIKMEDGPLDTQKISKEESEIHREQSAAPFNISSNRKGLFLNNGTPGPGTYNKVIDSNLIKNKKETQYYSCLDPTGDNVFISSETRFKKDYGDNPGPGQYNLNSSYTIKKDKYFSERPSRPKNLSHSNQRVLSIAPKDKSYGYNISTSGYVSFANDPDYSIRFSGEKNDSIAPNQYHLYEPPRRNNIVSWRLSDKSKRKKDLSSSFQNIDTGTSIKADDCLNVVPCKDQAKKNLTLFKNNNFGLKENSHKDKIDLVIFEEKNKQVPGPGAYYPYSYMDSKKFLPKPESLQNFGSTMTKSVALQCKDDNDGTGPGQYFRLESWTKEPNTNHIEKPKNTKEYHNNNKIMKIIQSRNDACKIVGPGKYDTDKSSFNSNKGASSNKTFGFLEKRFHEPAVNQSNPGAGSYIGLRTWADPLKQYNTKPRPTEIKIVEESSMPGVGQYHPEIYHSIEFNAQNKQSGIAPFESNSRRFPKQKLQNIGLGPGSYNLAKNALNIDIKKTGSPFITTSQRGKDFIINEDIKVGPGAYNLNSVFGWNKKSFNILFN